MSADSLSGEEPIGDAPPTVTAGYLRRGVLVEEAGEDLRLQSALWTVELPGPWVRERPDVSDFLAGKIPAWSLRANDAEVHALIRLLSAQGCLAGPEIHSSYSFGEVNAWFTRHATTWYGAYYSHPLWERLRRGEVSKNGLIAWLVSNYHLSRSAGMSAARSASRLADPKMRLLFAESALEEYSHCRDYYFVRHPRVSVPDSTLSVCVPLPSNIAFDQQMLRIAEDDGLAHTLSALFQETTASFADEFRHFYEDVEQAYALDGLFAPWQSHVDLDIEYGHAGAFSQALRYDRRCSRQDALRALRHTWFVFRFLLGALDDIVAHDRNDDQVRLREPLNTLADLGSSESALVQAFGTRHTPPHVSTLYELHVAMIDLDLLLPSDAPLLGMSPHARDSDFVRQDLVRSILRAMSYSTSEPEILLFGSLAETALSAESRQQVLARADESLPESPYAIAVANFLRESSTRPRLFAFLLGHLAAIDRLVELRCVPLLGALTAHLSPSLRGWRIDDAVAGDATTAALQLSELVAAWLRHGQEVCPDFYRD